MARIQNALSSVTERFQGFEQFRAVERFSSLRPISEFLNVKRISKPADMGEWMERVRYNLGHYPSNYAIVISMLAIYALITNPLLLFVMILVVGGMFAIGRLNGNNFHLGSIDITTSQLYTALFVISVPLFFFASPISTVLWLVGASCVVVGGHASLLSIDRNPFEPAETNV